MRIKTYAELYATSFEELSKKIVAKEIGEDKILFSELTKKTRDKGIDAILQTKDEKITVESKLRYHTKSLALKDIATSIVFYLLRFNEKHYVVSNVFLTSDTVSVLAEINKDSTYKIEYIAGKDTFRRIIELLPELNSEEKEIAEIIIQNYSEPKRASAYTKSPSITPKEKKMFTSQQMKVDDILGCIASGKKCTSLVGKVGTGKTTVMKHLNASLLETNKVLNEGKADILFIDCATISTIEAFVYSIFSLKTGMDMNDIIKEVVAMPDEFHVLMQSKSTLSRETLSSMMQIFRGSNQYEYKMEFLAKQCLDELLRSFFKNNIFIIDNFAAASLELAEFITEFIFSPSDNIQAIVAVDELENPQVHEILAKKINLYINVEKHQEISFKTLDKNESVEYISTLAKQKMTQSQAKKVFDYFGGNMRILEIVMSEVNKTPTTDVQYLRPYESSNILDRSFLFYANSSISALKALFVCWVMNSEIKQKYYRWISDEPIHDKLLACGVFDESTAGVKIGNMYYKRLLADYMIQNRHSISNTLSDLIRDLCSEKLPSISYAKVLLFTGDAEYCDKIDEFITEFNKKAEREYVLDARYYIYLLKSDGASETDLPFVESIANYLYEAIDYRHYRNHEDLVCTMENSLREINSYLYKLETSEKSMVATSAIKLALYLYFKKKRMNTFVDALFELKKCDNYLQFCKDDILVGKVLRFKALCVKSMGNKEKFLSDFKEYVKSNPNNIYLLGCYQANLAAHILYENPEQALKLIRDKALLSIMNVDDSLYLWLLNDELIYSFYVEKTLYNYEWYKKKANENLIMAERLCSVTDVARIYNFLGVVAMYYGEADESHKYLSESVYKMMNHEENNILFMFLTNYIQTVNEVTDLVEFLHRWVLKNSAYINQRIVDTSYKLSCNKTYVALSSYYKFLNAIRDSRAKEINKLFKAEESLMRKSIDPLFLVKDKTMILF